MSTRCGGIGALKEVDDDVRKVLKIVEEELKTKVSEKRNGVHPEKMEPVGYKTQVVAGLNYFVNIKLDDGEFIHVRIYRNLAGDCQVHSVTETKDGDVEILYF